MLHDLSYHPVGMGNQLVGTESPQSARWTGSEKRERLLASARELILERGYPATTVEQICEAAGVTKGAFFHYFDSKEAVGRGVIERFVSELVETFGSGPFREVADPLERVYAYIGFTIDVCKEAILQDGCILGLFSQELADTHPEIRALCHQGFRDWAQDLKGLLDEAKQHVAAGASIDTEALAEHFIALVEGSLILRKAHQDSRMVERALSQFEDHLRLLFDGDSGRG
jgi:TetR/AcrR family transcriptional regulator, transcriptional repressor for nem operon